MFGQAQKIISTSLRFTDVHKEQLKNLLSQSQRQYEGLQFIADKTVAPINKVSEEISLIELQIGQIVRLKNILIDFLVNYHESFNFESIAKH